MLPNCTIDNESAMTELTAPVAPVDMSIVVCTYNRAEMLRECLQSLMQQETAGEFTYEIVVVDNKSPDHTASVVEELAKTSPVPLRYVFESEPGQVHARHRGLDEARGEWIANFDDDEVATPPWALELLRLARKHNLLSVGGKLLLQMQEPTDRNLHPLVRRMLGESVLWDDEAPYSRRQGPGSGNQLLHRSVYEKVGRYDLNYQSRGYDTDHYRRIREAGIESWFAPKALAYHVTPPSRLTYKYLRETAILNGWCFCHRDLEHFGILRCAGVSLARWGLGWAYTLPRAGLAKVGGRSETALAYWLKFLQHQSYAKSFGKAAVCKLLGRPAF